ncbi:MAG: ATP-binding protein, partial [Clostridia bacterium]|nr:ATP-binding protein [Clostridia bacterium]
AYPNGKAGDVEAVVKIFEGGVDIEISDFGIGIDNLDQAKQPFYTSKPNSERSGMGFTVMESFMDEVVIINKPTGGLKVFLTKNILQENAINQTKSVR